MRAMKILTQMRRLSNKDMVQFIFEQLRKAYNNDKVEAMLLYRKYFVRIDTYDIYKGRVDSKLREHNMESIIQEV